jgi:hypothetical protein
MLGLLRATGLPTGVARDAAVDTVTVDLAGGEIPPARRDRARAHIAAAERGG